MLLQQFDQLLESVEALRKYVKRALGIAIEGLFEGLMMRVFRGELVM